MAKRTVTKGEDGFFRVSGQPETAYYTDKATADRVAQKLSDGDAAEEKATAKDSGEKDSGDSETVDG